MPRSVLPIAVAFLIALAGDLGAQCLVPARHHPWGRFEVGSWKKVQVVIEDLDESGNVLNTTRTETTTKLIQVDQSSYTLSIEVNSEVAGKPLPPQKKLVKKGFSGENVGDSVKLETVGEDAVVVSGRRIPSEVRRCTIHGGKHRLVSVVRYSNSFAPYVLTRETRSLDDDGMTTIYKSTGRVVVADMPYPIQSELKHTSIIQTVHEPPKGKIVTTEVHSCDIPGGVVAHTSTELTDEGQVVRRSQLQLMDYHSTARASSSQRPRLRDRLKMRFRPR